MSDQLHRRSFLGRLSAGAIAFLAAARASDVSAATPRMRAALAGSPDEWLKNLGGKHRQVFDATSVNDGFALRYAKTFLDTTKEASGLTDNDINAVIVFRHMSIPVVFQDAVWSKYKLGEFAKLDDPATKQPSVRNTFYKASGVNPAGYMVNDLLARGVRIGVCNVALNVISGMRAAAGGTSADVAKQEWTAGLIPGVTIIPSGVWGVNNAQEHGCTYCNAG